MTRPWNRPLSSRAATGLAALVIAVSAAVVPASPAFADSWSGWRTCHHPETLYVQSHAHAGFVHHLRNDTLMGAWTNGSKQWRTSLQGTGTQLAKINTGGSLDANPVDCGPQPL
jgi:hypothetical protein